MTGAEMLVKTAVAGGVEICFANAGTTEIAIVAALDAVKGIRPVLGLFEGVCTGAADGYGRMLEKPAMSLLHLGPGLGNGIANLHNARRAQTPIFNVVGEHASWHIAADPPLAMGIEGLARTVSGWQRTIRASASVSRDTADALAASFRGQVATLIAPADFMRAEGLDGDIAFPVMACDPPDADAIEKGAALLRSGKKTALILGGRTLRKQGLNAAARLKAAAGCDLLSVAFPACTDRGAGLPVLGRIPYFPKQALAMLSSYEAFLMVGTDEPVAFFGYQGGRSHFLDDNQRRLRLDTDGQDAVAVLEALADAIGAPAGTEALGSILAQYKIPELPTGALGGEKMCTVLAALQPEDAVVVEEGIMSGFTYHLLSVNLSPHQVLTLTGGAIGQGMPCALGAALACPERPVINIEADGSAMYTVQALWTQAREGANVTTLICNNRKYAIIGYEYRMAQKVQAPANARRLIDISDPDISWVRLSQGLGVPAVSVDTSEALARELGRAFEEPGPHLIEVLL